MMHMLSTGIQHGKWQRFVHASFFHFVTRGFSSDLRFSFSLFTFLQHSYLAFHSSNSTEVKSGLQLRRITLVFLIAKEALPGADRLPVVPLRDCLARSGDCGGVVRPGSSGENPQQRAGRSQFQGPRVRQSNLQSGGWACLLPGQAPQ
jgi:hypothetical protein